MCTINFRVQTKIVKFNVTIFCEISNVLICCTILPTALLTDSSVVELWNHFSFSISLRLFKIKAVL